MSGIEALRQRVLDAEKRFGLIDEERAKYSERLIGLMNVVEGRVREQQGEIDRLTSAVEERTSGIAQRNTEIESLKARAEGQGIAIAQLAEEIEKLKTAAGRMEEENERLRTMLHTLLQAIEGGSRDVLAETMVELDSKVSALMSSRAAESEKSPEGDTAALDDGSETVAEAPAEGEDDPAIEEPAAPAAEAPVALDVATPEPVAESPEPAAAEPSGIDAPAAEESIEAIAETVAAIREPASESAAPDSLDKIMQRVSKLVQENEPADAGSADTSWAAPAEDPAVPDKLAAATAL